MPMPFDDFERFVVVGLGMSGRASVRALNDRELEVAVFHHLEPGVEPDDDLVAFAAGLSASGTRVTLGGTDLSLLDWADVVVASPGLPPTNFFLKAAVERGIRVWSELELGWRLSRAPVIAITGTNGKTTTTTLVTDILESAGIPAISAGNIGVPFVEVVSHHTEGRTIVCEVSSFQLYFIDQFRPRVAVVLNVGDDHYDWHPGFDDYLAAKARITENQGDEDTLIVNAFDPACLQIAEGSKAKLSVFGSSEIEEVRSAAGSRLARTPEVIAGCSAERIHLHHPDGVSDLMSISDIRLQGAHNLENVLAAAAVCSEYRVQASDFSRAVSSFHGLPHRMAFVREVGSIRYIDDSKATNPHAAMMALQDLHDVVLIAGGQDRGLDLTPLLEARDRLKGLVVMGETAEKLEKLFAGMVPIESAASVEDAVALAAKLASPADTVLLSPGCASWDQYSSYAERGDRFQRAVMAL